MNLLFPSPLSLSFFVYPCFRPHPLATFSNTPNPLVSTLLAALWVLNACARARERLDIYTHACTSLPPPPGHATTPHLCPSLFLRANNRSRFPPFPCLYSLSLSLSLFSYCNLVSSCFPCTLRNRETARTGSGSHPLNIKEAAPSSMVVGRGKLER